MAVPTQRAEIYEAGDAWLADCSAHSAFVREVWTLEALAPITGEGRWLVAETRLVTGMQALNRIREDHRGPVLADPHLFRAWWLVPHDATEALSGVRPVLLKPACTALYCPPTGRQVSGRFWLSRPDGSGLLTDPAALAGALSSGRNRLLTEASG